MMYTFIGGDRSTSSLRWQTQSEYKKKNKTKPIYVRGKIQKPYVAISCLDYLIRIIIIIIYYTEYIIVFVNR